MRRHPSRSKINRCGASASSATSRRSSRHRHFTNAADELHVAQSALSHQVRRLERELGVELLQPHDPLGPADRGRRARRRPRPHGARRDRGAAWRDRRAARARPRPRRRSARCCSAASSTSRRSSRSFTATFPDVEIGLREGTAQRMVEMLADGSLDVTFALEVEPPEGLERSSSRARSWRVGDEPRPRAGRATGRCRCTRSPAAG